MSPRLTLLLVLFLLLAALPAQAAFPGTNGRIAFTSDRDGNQEIYTMNPDGSGQTNLTNHPAQDFDPAWSPDGTKIAFASDRDGGWEIYAMNADGTGVVRLTNEPALDWTPAWSPDGTKLVFTSYRAGGGEIFIMNANGSGVTQITDDIFYDRDPRWSSGNKIVFESERSNWEIFVMNTDGSGQVNVTNSTVYDFEPEWSPDGSRIAWRNSTGAGDIFAANMDGSGKVNLTNDPLVYDLLPAWAPDGSRIAYTSVQGNDFDIRLMNPDGTGKITITTSSGNDFEPDWGTSSGPPQTGLLLTITKVGQGSVRSTPAGIACGRDCSESYPSGATVVLLQSRPAAGDSPAGAEPAAEAPRAR